MPSRRWRPPATAPPCAPPERERAARPLVPAGVLTGGGGDVVLLAQAIAPYGLLDAAFDRVGRGGP